MTGRIALVGVGLIGRGWAVVFARAGYQVALYDSKPGAVDAAMTWLEAGLRDLEASGLIASAAAVSPRLQPCASLGEAVAGALYIQESAPEDRDLKYRVCAEIDAMAGPDAVIGSSCSAIPPSLFLEDIPGRARCLVAHPANPPHLMPVVEMVPSPWTSEAALETARSLMAAVGQMPVRVKKEVTGFVMNRLQAAVVNEAISLVAAGVMSPDDVDKTMRYSIGLRWSFMGPFETMDLNASEGFKDYATRYGMSYASIGSDLHVADPWSDAVIDDIEAARRNELPRERVGERQAWRDRRLMALLAHMAEADKNFGK